MKQGVFVMLIREEKGKERGQVIIITLRTQEKVS